MRYWTPLDRLNMRCDTRATGLGISNADFTLEAHTGLGMSDMPSSERLAGVCWFWSKMSEALAWEIPNVSPGVRGTDLTKLYEELNVTSTSPSLLDACVDVRDTGLGTLDVG